MRRSGNRRKRGRNDAASTDTATDAVASTQGSDSDSDSAAARGLRRSKRLRNKRKRESRSTTISDVESDAATSDHTPTHPPRAVYRRPHGRSRISTRYAPRMSAVNSPPLIDLAGNSDSDNDEDSADSHMRFVNRARRQLDDVSNRHRRRRRRVSYAPTSTTIHDPSSNSNSNSNNADPIQQQSSNSSSSSSSSSSTDSSTSLLSSLSTMNEEDKSFHPNNGKIEPSLAQASMILQYFKSVKEYMSCLICTEVMAAPITLDCGHSFCYTCIMQWIEQYQCDAPGHDHHADCPTCRKHIQYSRMRPRKKKNHHHCIHHGRRRHSSLSRHNSSTHHHRNSTSSVAAAAASAAASSMSRSRPGRVPDTPFPRPIPTATMANYRSSTGMMDNNNSNSRRVESDSDEYVSDILDEMRMSVAMQSMVDGLIHLDGLFTEKERESYQTRLNEYERMIARLRNDERRREYELKNRRAEMNRRDRDRFITSIPPFFSDMLGFRQRDGDDGRTMYALLHHAMHEDEDEEDDSDSLVQVPLPNESLSSIRLSSGGGAGRSSRSRDRSGSRSRRSVATMAVRRSVPSSRIRTRSSGPSQASTNDTGGYNLRSRTTRT